MVGDNSEMELFVMLGLLIREYNYSLISRGRTPEWIQLVERLFWMMDSTGRGLVTLDGKECECYGMRRRQVSGV